MPRPRPRRHACLRHLFRLKDFPYTVFSISSVSEQELELRPPAQLPWQRHAAAAGVYALQQRHARRATRPPRRLRLSSNLSEWRTATTVPGIIGPVVGMPEASRVAGTADLRAWW